jgi:hypothetical protein
VAMATISSLLRLECKYKVAEVAVFEERGSLRIITSSGLHANHLPSSLLHQPAVTIIPFQY